MSNKNFDIKITTKADQSGAKQTDKSLGGLKSKLDNLSSSGVGFSSKFASGMKMLLSPIGLVTAGVSALAAALVGATKLLNAFGEQESLDMKQAAILKATGEQAGYSAGQLKEMSAALSEMSGESDESISAAQNLMLTFTNVSGPVFQDAMGAVMDMGTLFGSTESAAVQLGKALNDPVVGISALSRVGITFNDQQKEQIKSFTDQNDLMSAQRVILSELSREFGGTAQAAAQGWTGTTKRLSNAWGDLKQAMGGVLAASGTAQAAFGGLTSVLRAFESAIAGPAVEQFADKIANELADSAKTAAEQFDALKKAATEAIDQTAAASDAKLEKLRKNIEMEKQLALAQLELQKAQGELPESEYQRRKTAISGAATHEEYGAQRDAIAQQETAIADQLAALEQAAQKAAEAADALTKHFDASYRTGIGRELGRVRSHISDKEKEESTQSVVAGGYARAGMDDDAGLSEIRKTLSALRAREKELAGKQAEADRLAPKYRSAKTKKEQTQFDYDAFQKAAAAKLADLQEAFNTLETGRKISETLQEVGFVNAGNTARQEQEKRDAEAKQKEKEEADAALKRDAALPPEQRVSKAKQNVMPIADYGGSTYTGPIGAATQQKGQQLIDEASAAILSGKDDLQIIQQLSRKWAEVGAVYRGGFKELAKQLDRLDGEVENVKSIVKVNR